MQQIDVLSTPETVRPPIEKESLRPRFDFETIKQEYQTLHILGDQELDVCPLWICMVDSGPQRVEKVFRQASHPHNFLSQILRSGMHCTEDAMFCFAQSGINICFFILPQVRKGENHFQIWQMLVKNLMAGWSSENIGLSLSKSFMKSAHYLAVAESLFRPCLESGSTKNLFIHSQNCTFNDMLGMASSVKCQMEKAGGRLFIVH